MAEARVTTAQAAKELQMSRLTLCTLLLQGRIPIGYAVKRPGAKQATYVIYRRLLDEEKKRNGL